MCHTWDITPVIMAPRTKNKAPTRITRRAPYRSVAIPVNGASKAPVMLASEKPRVMAAGLQPMSCWRGTIRTPKACRMEPPAI